MNIERYHIAFGRHSNIPDCCIQFYVTEWYPFFENKWRGTVYYDAVQRSEFKYVPCPKCYYMNQKAEIRICAVECGGDHPEDFR
jgi:hypothetical protein